jgi:hypothetical protein
MVPSFVVAIRCDQPDVLKIAPGYLDRARLSSQVRMVPTAIVAGDIRRP